MPSATIGSQVNRVAGQRLSVQGAMTGLAQADQRWLRAAQLGRPVHHRQLTGVVCAPRAARAGTRLAAIGVPSPVTGSHPVLAL